jgi:hypothetical protein
LFPDQNRTSLYSDVDIESVESSYSISNKKRKRYDFDIIGISSNMGGNTQENIIECRHGDACSREKDILRNQLKVTFHFTLKWMCIYFYFDIDCGR